MEVEVEVEVAVMAVAAVAVVVAAARHLQGSERVQRRAQEAVPLSEREGVLDRDRWRRRARAALAAATADAGRDGAAARPALLACGVRAVRLRVCEAPCVRDASHRTAALLLQNGLLLLRLVLREAPRL